MKSLKESLLSTDIEDLAVELPQIKSEILNNALNDMYCLDNIESWAWIERIDAALDGPVPNYCSDMQKRLEKMMVDFKHYTPKPRNVQKVRNTKAFWEELDKVVQKSSIAKSIDLSELDTDFIVNILVSKITSLAQRYNLCQELMKSKWVEAAGFDFDTKAGVIVPASQDDPSLGETRYCMIQFSGKFKKEYNR